MPPARYGAAAMTRSAQTISAESRGDSTRRSETSFMLLRPVHRRALRVAPRRLVPSGTEEVRDHRSRIPYSAHRARRTVRARDGDFRDTVPQGSREPKRLDVEAEPVNTREPKDVFRGIAAEPFEA